MSFLRQRAFEFCRAVVSGGAVQMATALLAIGVLTSAAVYWFANSHYSAQREASKRTTFGNIVDDIETRFKLYAHELRALRSFAGVDSLPSMTRSTFEQFASTRSFSTDFPGARGIGLIRYLKPQDVPAFLLEKRLNDGYPNFGIRQITPHDGDQFVIQFLYPREGNGEAIGLDISSEPHRKSAALLAVERDSPTLSAPIRLVQANNKGASGLLFLLPVFRKGASLWTYEERLAALEGWTYYPLAVDEVIADITARYKHWRLSIIDEDAKLLTPLFDSISQTPGLSAQISDTVNMNGRHWKISAASTEGLTAVGNHEAYLLAGTTFVLFAVIAGFVYSRIRQLAKEQALSSERARLADIVAHAADAMLSTDAEGRVESWNAAACRLFRISEADIAGCNVGTLFSDEPEPIFAGLRAGRALPDEGLTLKTMCLRRDGTQFPGQISFFALGSAGHLGVSVRDLSDEQAFEECILELTHKLRAEVKERTSQLNQSLELQAEIQHLAMHDPLTGLVNRTLFRERLVKAVQAHAEAPEHRFALLALDLDRFKPVNDTYGHPIGDALLTQIADRLRACLSPEDTVARLGGDEFAILLKAGTCEVQAIAAANRVLEAIEKPFEVDGLLLEIGVSVGIALHDDTLRGVNADDFFKLADHALYKAKRNGRGGYHLGTDVEDAEGAHTSRLAIEMRDALRKGEFHLMYQPIIDCAMSRLDGFEALLRWQHPTRGPVSPVEFIPVAEESDQIVAIGEWALRAACEDAASWENGVTVSVNVSPAQIKRSGWDDSVIAILQETGLDPARLIIEVTESVLMTDSATVLDRLKRVQNYGVAIALDDFGTGYSSLSYLRKFRFDKLKIDKSFMRDAGDVVCAAIIRCIVRLGRQLSMTVVAEGIETDDQLALVEREGCSHAQGFYFSKPMLPVGVPAFIVAMRIRQAAGLRTPRTVALRKSA